MPLERGSFNSLPTYIEKCATGVFIIANESGLNVWERGSGQTLIGTLDEAREICASHGMTIIPIDEPSPHSGDKWRRCGALSASDAA
jgi:hypothetical protein